MLRETREKMKIHSQTTYCRDSIFDIKIYYMPLFLSELIYKRTFTKKKTSLENQ